MSTAPVAGAPAQGGDNILGLAELRANVEGGVWDQVKLAAKFFVATAANAAHEVFIDLPQAILRADDPVSYQIERAKRGVETLREIGAWAVDNELVPPDAKATAALPRYQRYI